MQLSDIGIKEINILQNNEFDILSHCTVNTSRKSLSFIDSIKYIDIVNKNQNITCLVCNNELLDYINNKNLGIIISENPRLTFFNIHNFISMQKSVEYRLKTIIGANTNISKMAVVSAQNVRIGDNVIIEENVLIRDNVEIGNNTIIRAGTIIGGQGYEFKIDRNNNQILRVNHCGKVIIGNHVEIKEFSTIHTAVFDWDTTQIGTYSKLDAHTHIGHGTKLGKRVMLGSHSNLAGNITIGDDVYIGPGVTITNRVYIGNNAKISIGSVVSKDVESNRIVTGNFAIPHEAFIKDLKNKFL